MLRTLRDPATDPHVRILRLRAIALEHAEGLCERLPGEWSPLPNALYQAAIGSGDGRQLLLTATTGAKGEDRLQIGARLESELERFTRGYHEISVTLAKNVDVIAREIGRRLLPDLDEELAVAQAMRSAEETRQARFDAALARIEQTLPAARPDPDGRLNARFLVAEDGMCGEIAIDRNGLTGELHLHGVGLDLLTAIAEAIAEPQTSAPASS